MSKMTLRNVVVELTEEQEERLRRITEEKNEIMRKKGWTDWSEKEILGVIVGVCLLTEENLNEAMSEEEKYLKAERKRNHE